jgi:hypothetical protein
MAIAIPCLHGPPPLPGYIVLLGIFTNLMCVVAFRPHKSVDNGGKTANEALPGDIAEYAQLVAAAASSPRSIQ